MKVMFIVYHDIKTEARSQEILDCAKKIGETVFVSYSKPFNESDCKCIQTGSGKRKYTPFIMGAIKAIRKENPDIVILHDNYTAIILKWIQMFKRNIYVIYDSSELYIDKIKNKSLKVRIASFMRYLERKYLKCANVVIAANIERATIMKEYFELKETPIIFNNVHRIDEQYDLLECNEKYNHIFEKDVFSIVYGGGIGEDRMTFELAEAVGKLGPSYQLIIVGQTTEEEQKRFFSYIKKKNYKNIYYHGFVPRGEWRYILSKAHISVSAFAQDNLNNINCASGKLYESLFEGKPILTSENPPLKRICNEYGVGVSSDDFTKGIVLLRDNYELYCENVQRYIRTLDVEGRIDVLADTLRIKLHEDIR